MPSLVLLLLLAGDLTHVPPLVPGREEVVQLAAGEHGLLRYEAVWDVTVHVEASTEDELGLFVELVDAREEVLAAEVFGRGTARCDLACSLSAGETVFVRFGSLSTDGPGSVYVSVEDAPDFESHTSGAKLHAAPWPPAGFDQRLARAREAVAEADKLANERATARCYLAVGKALKELEAVEGSESYESGAALHWTLARAARECANNTVALATIERVMPFYRAFGPTHPRWLSAKGHHAITLSGLGEHARALREVREVLVLREKTLPVRHPDLVWTMWRYAWELSKLGDHPAARDMALRILELQLAAPDPQPRRIAEAQRFAAIELQWLGDVRGAHRMLEAAYDTLHGVVEPDDMEFLNGQLLLGSVLRELGDLTTARALQEEVLAAYTEKLSPFDVTLLWARGALAITRRDQGELEAAHETIENVLGIAAMARPDDHWDLQIGRIHFAITKRLMGDFEGAAELLEEVIDVLEEGERPDRPELVWARGNLAWTVRSQGELEEARELMQRMLGEIARIFPDHHYGIAQARRAHAFVLDGLGDRKALGAHLVDVERGARERLRSSRALAPREAAALARALDADVSALLSLVPRAEGEGELAARAFELVETIRSVSAFRSVPGHTDDPVLARARGRVLAARRWVNDLVAGAGVQADDELSAADMARATRERDMAERALEEVLRARGVRRLDVTVEAVAAGLPEDSAAVSYRVYERRWTLPEAPHETRAEPALVAHVVRADGTLARVDLGTLGRVTELVRDWRSTVGRAVAGRGDSTQRGVSVALGSTTDGALPGAGLREAILDPVLAAAGSVSTLFVCLDGPLHLVPLDALTLGEGVVGDDVRLHVLGTFLQLMAPGTPVASEPSLLALGGIDFDSPGAAPPQEATRRSVSALRAARAGPGGRAFAPLPGTLSEVEELGRLFRESFDGDATVLTDSEASWEALNRLAPARRYVHLATHGYFAEEAFADERRAADEAWFVAPLTVGSAVRELAPMALCGVALAGANQGRDEQGRTRGILTGEEIAGLDLGACELAVLSACETNVGVSWTGLGIQSLQSALHAAGARTVLTSLWVVDDESSRALMVDFYRRAWRDGIPKGEALWEAKRALRSRGAPLEDWAGWVLTGDF